MKIPKLKIQVDTENKLQKEALFQGHTPTPWVIAYDQGEQPNEVLIRGPKAGYIVCVGGSRIGREANAAYIVKAVNAHEELVDAVRSVDIYFKALCEQWANNDGRVVSSSGTVIDASKDVERLCEIAAMKVSQALAKAEGR